MAKRLVIAKGYSGKVATATVPVNKYGGVTTTSSRLVNDALGESSQQIIYLENLLRSQSMGQRVASAIWDAVEPFVL